MNLANRLVPSSSPGAACGFPTGGEVQKGGGFLEMIGGMAKLKFQRSMVGNIFESILAMEWDNMKLVTLRESQVIAYRRSVVCDLGCRWILIAYIILYIHTGIS